MPSRIVGMLRRFRYDSGPCSGRLPNSLRIAPWMPPAPRCHSWPQ
jgi:hypothetical protein